MQVNIFEAKNQLSQLIKSVQAGEEVIIANRGAPVARLVPVEPPIEATSSATGRADSFLQWLEDQPLPEYARRSASEIDARIAQERESWGD